MIDLVVALHLYWQCDWEYHRGLRSPQEMLACIEIADRIKQEQFQGDFDQYLRWWRENRDLEHEIRD